MGDSEELIGILEGPICRPLYVYIAKANVKKKKRKKERKVKNLVGEVHHCVNRAMSHCVIMYMLYIGGRKPFFGTISRYRL